MGCGPKGFDEIKKHPFFSRINWSRLETLQLTPSFTPDPKTLNFNVNLELQSQFGKRRGSVVLYKRPKDVQRALLNHETLVLMDHFKTFNCLKDVDESGYDLADRFTPVKPPSFGAAVHSVDVRKQKVIQLGASADNAAEGGSGEGLVDTEDEAVKRRRSRLRSEMIEIQEIDAVLINKSNTMRKPQSSPIQSPNIDGLKDSPTRQPGALKYAPSKKFHALAMEKMAADEERIILSDDDM